MVDLPAKKKKRQSGLPMSSRNAVGLLNELRTGVEFTLVAQTGPVHCPVFTMAVTVRYRNIQLFTLRFQWESYWFTEACHGTYYINALTSWDELAELSGIGCHLGCS